MRTTIDSAGRLVIPKAIREAAHLEPGMPLEISLHDERIELQAVPQEMRLVRKGRLTVAVATEEPEPLIAEVVRSVQESLRERRLQD